VPSNTQICFLDDQHHPLMENDRVYYINVKPFSYSLPYIEMAERYYDKYSPGMPRSTFIDGIKRYMGQYNYKVVNKSEEEKAVDIVIGKQILLHLNEFFNNKMLTKKHGTIKKRKHRKGKKNTRRRKQ